VGRRFPYANLRRAVHDATHAAFDELRSTHRGDTFYAYAIWTNDIAQSVTAVANSLEGLDRTVARYQAEGHSDADANGMRWSYGDWDFQMVGERHFRTVNEILLSAITAGSSDGDDVASERRRTKILAAIVGGFKDLDAEGFFGTESERAEVALLIVGDVDEPFAERCIRELNPASVVSRLLKPKSLPPDCNELGPPRCQPTKDMALAPDGGLLLVATDDSILGFDVPGFAERKPLRLPRGRASELASFEIRAIAFSPDGSEFVSSHISNSYGVVARWSVGKRKLISVTGRLEWGCNALVWSPDGTTFAGACRDKVIRLWSVDSFDVKLELASHGRQTRCLGFSPDGQTLVSLDADSGAYLRTWDPATGAVQWQVADEGMSFAFVPSDDRLAVVPLSSSEPCEVHFRSCHDGAIAGRIGVGIHASAIAFSSDGRLMAIGGFYSTPTLELWEVGRGLRLGAVEIDAYAVLAMRFVDSDRAIAVIASERYGNPPLLLWRIARFSGAVAEEP
jgi:uncharacterized protein YukE